MIVLSAIRYFARLMTLLLRVTSDIDWRIGGVVHLIQSGGIMSMGKDLVDNYWAVSALLAAPAAVHDPSSLVLPVCGGGCGSMMTNERPPSSVNGYQPSL
jgi:hypothetical protein